MRRLWRRFFTLRPRERALLGQAALTLALTRVGLWLIPLGNLRRLLEPSSRSAGNATAGEIAWAIAAAARRLPWMTCLVEALTAQRLLRQAGLSCELRIGMRRAAGNRPIEAHAWVVSDGQVVAGRDSMLSAYVVLSPSGSG